MTLLTSLMIVAATLVVVGVAVLSTIAAVAEALPPRSGQGDERVSTTVSAPRVRALSGRRSQATGIRA